MVNIEEMIHCKGKRIIVTYTDNDTFEGYCTCFQQSEDEDEEPMLEFGNTVIFQSEIKSIEILD